MHAWNLMWCCPSRPVESAWPWTIGGRAWPHRGRTIDVIARTTAFVVLLGVVVAALIPATRLPWNRPGMASGSAALVVSIFAASWAYRVARRWRVLASWRIERALLGRFPWREAPATVLGGGPRRVKLCGARVELPGGPVLVRFWLVPWSVQWVIVRTGRLWLCGPDRRGRAKVRVDGMIGLATVRVVDSLPTAPPTPRAAEPTGPRPTDEAQLTGGPAYVAREYRAARLPLVQVAVGLAILGWALSAHFGAFAALGAGLVLSVVPQVYHLAWVVVRARPARRLLDRADRWTPLPAEIQRWSPLGNGPAGGRVRLPDVGWVPIRMNNIAMDNVANIQATGTVWLAGDPVPGGRIAVGVPGHPWFAKARLGRPDS